MLRPSYRPRIFLRLAMVGVLTLVGVATALRAQSLTPLVVPPGGLIEPTSSTAARPLLTAAQIQGILPSRGPFLFPAPYGTQGVRLTNASDCVGGGDCVYSVGYSYWRNTNNHVGSNTMLIFVGLVRSKGGAGPSLFSYDKVTGDTRNLGPLFDESSAFSWATGEGWYFSATQPTTLYVSTPGGSEFYRYDVLTHTSSLVFDATTRFGGDASIWQIHSSNDDTVHSFTLRSKSSGATLGCSAYVESTRQFAYFPAVGGYDECAVDASGRYVVIKDGLNGGDNRIHDLQAGTVAVFSNQAGAVGHSDNGFGVMVGEDDYNSLPGATRLWNLGQPFPAQGGSVPGQGVLVYHRQDWATGLGHVTLGNARSDIPVAQQHACVSHAHRTNAPRVNELICFKLDGSLDVLVVAPNMIDLNAAGGLDDYWKLPKANLDVTGEYLAWTANQGGGRQDAFLVRVPTHRLGNTGGGGDTTAPTVAITAPAGGSTVQGSVTVSATAADNVAVTSVQFLLNGVPAGVPLQTGPYTVAWLSGNTPDGVHTLAASARDAAGNVTTSTPVTVTVSNNTPAVDKTAPTVAITSPAGGSTVQGSVTVSATAADNVKVTSVQFLLDGVPAGVPVQTSPYTVTWLSGNTPNGVHTLAASARDAAGNVATSTPVTVTVSNNTTSVDKTAPTVALTSPAGGSTVQGSVTVSATAADNVKVTSVQFLLDGVPAGVPVQTSPYTVTWLSGNTPNGVHTLAASARDAAGNVAMSTPITVTVSNNTSSSSAVVWAGLVRTQVNGGTLQKTGGCDGCPDAGAVSQQRITSGAGHVEFTATETGSLRMLGLSNNNPGTSMEEIRFGLRLQAGNAEVRESGTYRADVAFSPGDVLRIAVSAQGVISYSKNGTVFYKSKRKAAYPLLVDTSFATLGGTILGAVIVGGK